MNWWMAIAGHEEYWVSADGRVMRNGRVLSNRVAESGHLRVVLSRNSVADQQWVHRLVAKAFIPNPDNLPFVRHLDDVPSNNDYRNLAWGTQADNSHDALRNRRNYFAERTHCNHGHPFIEGNLYFDRGRRVCRTCKLASVKAHATRVKEKANFNK